MMMANAVCLSPSRIVISDLKKRSTRTKSGREMYIPLARQLAGLDSGYLIHGKLVAP